jgi:hypothetical protein
MNDTMYEIYIDILKNRAMPRNMYLRSRLEMRNWYYIEIQHGWQLGKLYKLIPNAFPMLLGPGG